MADDTQKTVMVEDVAVLESIASNNLTTQQRILRSTDNLQSKQQGSIIDQCIERLADVAEQVPYTVQKHVKAQMVTLYAALEVDEVEAMYSDEPDVMASALLACDWRMGNRPQGIVKDWEIHIPNPHANTIEMLGMFQSIFANQFHKHQPEMIIPETNNNQF